jgi:hypothetical protein
LLATALCCLTSFAAAASQVQVYQELKHDVSQPLRDMVKQVPVQKGAPHEADIRRFYPTTQSPLSEADRAVKPDVNGSRPLVGTTAGLNIDGQGADGVAPPDTNGSVGLTQYVQGINTEYSVYDKTTGARTLGPLAFNAIWSGFGGACQSQNSGDIIVLYDKAASRWFFAQNTFSKPYTICVAVSTSDDATGTYNRYSWAITPTTAFPDYPKWGVWSDAYYQSWNDFNNGSTATNSHVCAVDRTNILAGNAATVQCFNTSSATYFSLLPADLDGATAPPAGEAETFVDYSNTTHINFWKFHVDFVTPANSTFTGPTAVTVTGFTKICTTTRGCVPEPTGGEKLDGLPDRLMYRAAYRNYGTYEQLLVSQTVKPVSHTTSTAAVRWYEFRNIGGTPTVQQQATFQDAGTKNYWLPTIAADKQGNIAMGFSVSDASTNPSLWYTGRLVSDPVNTMEASNILVTGTGVQKSTSNRWGDYASMSVDPSDDCTFWFTSEYIKTTGSFNWSTRIGSFKFSGCQ